MVILFAQRQMSVEETAGSSHSHMKRLMRSRINSGGWAVLLLIIIEVLSNFVSSELTVGRLTPQEQLLPRATLYAAWVAFIVALLVAAVLLWAINNVPALRITIFVANGCFTVQLFVASLLIVVRMIQSVKITVVLLIVDALIIFVTNILIFTLWYWFIDSANTRFFKPSATTQWDFLFPQRQTVYLGYENWSPKFSDYVFLAYTTSVAFSPAETAPLSRTAKVLMMAQSVISLITIVVVAGTAINILASSA